MTERENLEPTNTKLPQVYETVHSPNSDNSTVRTQAAFVNKLYKMLEDGNIQHLISWSDRGDSFSVSNPTSFSKTVLPQYFKHNNWQSFVRQLNMYGFHKVNDMIHSNLNSDNQTWEFKHPHFKRGEIDDLQNIKRKSAKPNFSSLPARIPNNMPRIQSDNDEEVYGPLYKHILHIEDRLHHVSQSYEILKNETNTLRGLLTKQQQTIGEFATVLGQVLQDEAHFGADESKRESILTKLSELQTLISNDISQSSLSNQTLINNTRICSNSSISTANNFQITDNYTPEHTSQQESSPPSSARTFDQFVHAQLRSRSSFSSQSSSSTSASPNNVTKNKRLGFGKESHLLNPEPFNTSYPSIRETKSIDSDNYMKKQRTE